MELNNGFFVYTEMNMVIVHFWLSLSLILRTQGNQTPQETVVPPKESSYIWTVNPFGHFCL